MRFRLLPVFLKDAFDFPGNAVSLEIRQGIKQSVLSIRDGLQLAYKQRVQIVHNS